ncbi:MAG: hypothetical protein KKF85_03015 [Gammaproteobacteria bacterium]|nr:hypothetical protein [Gammaproteobacteria bacterium]MBU3988404.1 hypothetical protein [Gammaproteobacteria bacterium]MBU4004823.1 hypothetical protein [Gammaproteobacteria bacterium]MBU4021426.1 hypothetical protein [Gammaproteobacteria bacterium]MBU4096443.1 hypothetical protein [Gammaproteobacteria bacterium]
MITHAAGAVRHDDDGEVTVTLIRARRAADGGDDAVRVGGEMAAGGGPAVI